VSVDRINARDTDAESVEEPPPTDRTPPPDTPGQAEGASRADSRAGAAVANAAASEQQGGTAEDRPDEPQDEDPADEAPSTAVETTPPEPERVAEDEAYGAGDQDTDAIDDAPATEPVPSDGVTDEVAEQDSATADPDDGTENASGSADTVTAPEEASAGENDDEPRSADLVPVDGAPANEPPAPAAGEHTTVRGRDTPARLLEPLTDREYTEHTERVEANLTAAILRGETTDVTHTTDAERTAWRPDRAKHQQQIIDDLYSAAADVPEDGHAIIVGGLGGAGKSTTLDEHAGIDRSNYLTINPDDIKESMANRGMIPPVKGLAPMERSALVHEESSEIATSLAARAYADRKNVIWDITMSSRSSATRRLQQLREAGYRNVQGIFVHIPVEKSVERAQARHRSGVDDYRNGEGLGGRYVPPAVIRANTDSTWGSVNRAVFEDLKPQFDSWKLYDNSVDGRGSVILESSDVAERDDDE
jgi:predicted ABC-type ATPase